VHAGSHLYRICLYPDTVRKRTICALVLLRLSENLEENLDNKLLWAMYFIS